MNILWYGVFGAQVLEPSLDCIGKSTVDPHLVTPTTRCTCPAAVALLVVNLSKTSYCILREEYLYLSLQRMPWEVQILISVGLI